MKRLGSKGLGKLQLHRGAVHVLTQATPLHLAVLSGDTTLVELLLDLGAQTKFGHSVEGRRRPVTSPNNNVPKLSWEMTAG